MPRYYTYLISSLPVLHFASKPQFSYEKFIRMCEGLILDSELAFLSGLPKIAEKPYKDTRCTLDKWFEFDRDIRNELVKIRSSRKKIDAAKYVRPDDGYVEPYITHVALHAHRNPSPLEAERILDQERWNKLEDLSSGHYFDFDFLIIYGLKLLLLWRWENIRVSDKASLRDKFLHEEITV